MLFVLMSAGSRYADTCDGLQRLGRRQVDSSALTFSDERHHPGAHAPCAALGLDVVTRDRRYRHQTLKICSARKLGAVLRTFNAFGVARLHREGVATSLNHRFYVSFIALLSGQYE